MNSAENVSVKPLEWHEYEAGFRAKKPFGSSYYVQEMISGYWNWYGFRFASPDEAKAAAQADYEQSVLSCLLSPPTEDADRVEPVAVIRFDRSPGNENEMPKVVSCDWLPDGLYSVYLRPETVGVSDAGLLKALQDNCWDLRCIASPIADTGDADIDWIVIEHHMAKPHERVIGRGSTPLQALNAVLSPQGDDPLRERLARITEHRATLSPGEYPEEQPSPLSPQEGE